MSVSDKCLKSENIPFFFRIYKWLEMAMTFITHTLGKMSSDSQISDFCWDKDEGYDVTFKQHAINFTKCGFGNYFYGIAWRF